MKTLSLAALLLALSGSEPSMAQSMGRPSHGDWKNPLFSLIVPGAGQIAAGQERGAVYLVAEAFLLTRMITERNEATRERNGYRNLALNVARRTFGGVRTDTVFEYYDMVGKFIESGPFSTTMDGTLNPPTDLGTFNGSIWELARRTFLADPDNPDPTSEEYGRALDFYRRRAIGPNFTWSWRNAALEKDLYRLSIRKSDDAFRRASNQLGALLANHILSAVDAFISYRLTNGRAMLRTSLLPGEGRGPPDFSFQLTVGF